mmetsp:Transcript_2154/g.4445  ORF Transcript_2154/g.4445 Transcript_2154/m.4445 type:complete len:213 (+) Transcript_2154:392-1030(+)
MLLGCRHIGVQLHDSGHCTSLRQGRTCAHRVGCSILGRIHACQPPTVTPRKESPRCLHSSLCSEHVSLGKSRAVQLEPTPRHGTSVLELLDLVEPPGFNIDWVFERLLRHRPPAPLSLFGKDLVSKERRREVFPLTVIVLLAPPRVAVERRVALPQTGPGPQPELHVVAGPAHLLLQTAPFGVKQTQVTPPPRPRPLRSRALFAYCRHVFDP